MIVSEKFGQHQPLNRQAERCEREVVPLSLSTLADKVGTVTSVLTPLFERISKHVLAAERLHGDDTTVSVLASKNEAGCWAHARRGFFELAGIQAAELKMARGEKPKPAYPKP